ncbi:hypothetical protein Tco_0301245, partial [Tanacetum coccineum]
MLSSDATFSMEMFPFGHCQEGNGDVSSVCFLSDDGKDLRPADLLLFNWLQ